MEYSIVSASILISFFVGHARCANNDPKLYPIFDYPGTRILEYKVANTLKCNVSGSLASAGLTVGWLKDDIRIDPQPNKYRISNNQLTILRTTEEDIETYTCVLEKKTELGPRYVDRANIQTIGKPTVKINSQGTFIQGQKIRLECVTQGKPQPTIVWRLGNETFTASTGRIKLLENEKKQPNAILVIDSAEMIDRGNYFCQASNRATTELNITVEAATYVRVKDKLAALWPFIGICAEVIVLCAIIFIYERKRNKTELEESDTDISPDQKNTPDHGKDSVRQRK